MFAGFLPRSAAAPATALCSASTRPGCRWWCSSRRGGCRPPCGALSRARPRAPGGRLPRAHRSCTRRSPGRTLAELAERLRTAAPRRGHAGAGGRSTRRRHRCRWMRFPSWPGRSGCGGRRSWAHALPARRATSSIARSPGDDAAGQLDPAARAHMATVMLSQAGARPAKHAHIVRGGERDGVPPHTDLERDRGHRSPAAAGSPRGSRSGPVRRSVVRRLRRRSLIAPLAAPPACRWPSPTPSPVRMTALGDHTGCGENCHGSCQTHVLLCHHTDLLRELRSPPGARVHDRGHRRAGPLQARPAANRCSS